jgi:DNA-binding beta-propeller fold protein YncE
MPSPSRRFPSRLRPLVSFLVAGALLAACGGNDDAGVPTSSSVAGVVAVGAALAGANVEFVCTGNSPAATKTGADGTFSVAGEGVTFPCVAVATGGTAGGNPNTDTLYAALTGAGTANVTTLSTLQLAYVAGQDLQAWVAAMRNAPTSLAAAVTPARLETALGALRTQMAALAIPLPAGFDPVKSAFKADGVDPLDQLLDKLKASLAAGGSTLKDAAAQANAGQALVERTPAAFTMEKIGGFAHAGGVASAEIVAFDPLSKRLFTVNGALGTVDVLDLSNPAQPVALQSIATSSFGTGLGGVNSVAIHNGVVALAVEASPKTNNGIVALLRASDLHLLGTAPAGALPDMLTFSPDGRHILVANEGEPNSYGQADSVDPEGSITIIEVAGLAPNAKALTLNTTQVKFTAFDSQAASLRAAGVRIYGPNATVSQDLEPEYITVSADGKRAWVTLQENNAVAVVDIAAKSVTAVKPLGLKDHSVAGMGLDASDRDSVTNANGGTASVKIANYPLKAMYLPDGIASYSVNGQTYLITANEGDAREYTGIPGGREDPRLGSHCSAGLDPAVYADATNMKFDSNLGRLRVSAMPNGTRNGKNAGGLCDEVHALGGRSISIWNADVQRVWDSGDQMEQRTAAIGGLAFNASNDNNTTDDRSPAKGPEPEGVVVGRIGTKTFAFAGLERVGGVMVWDVTNPAAPVYVTYLNTRTGATGDRGPEGLQFVRAAHSPNGKPLLLVGHETSGTTAVYQLNLSY